MSAGLRRLYRSGTTIAAWHVRSSKRARSPGTDGRRSPKLPWPRIARPNVRLYVAAARQPARRLRSGRRDGRGTKARRWPATCPIPPRSPGAMTSWLRWSRGASPLRATASAPSTRRSPSTAPVTHPCRTRAPTAKAASAPCWRRWARRSAGRRSSTATTSSASRERVGAPSRSSRVVSSSCRVRRSTRCTRRRPSSTGISPRCVPSPSGTASAF